MTYQFIQKQGDGEGGVSIWSPLTTAGWEKVPDAILPEEKPGICMQLTCKLSLFCCKKHLESSNSVGFSLVLCTCKFLKGKYNLTDHNDLLKFSLAFSQLNKLLTKQKKTKLNKKLGL